MREAVIARGETAALSSSRFLAVRPVGLLARRYAPFALWLAALFPRLGLSLIFLHAPIALDDMFQYDMLARSLASGKGYRWYAAEDIEVMRPYLAQFLDLAKVDPPADGLLTTFRAPGYPFLLAAVYSLIPLAERFAIIRVVQSFLTALSAPLVTLLALKMGLRRRTAMVAGLGMAFYPILLFYPLGLASENLFIPLVLIACCALLSAVDSRRLWPYGAAGLLLGLASLTRSILLAFVLLAAAWSWRYGQARTRGALLVLLTSAAVCLPWSLRNSLVMGQPASVETSLGYNLFVGAHPQGNGGFVSKVAILPLAILDDAERDQYCTAAALAYVRADPLEAAVRVARRAAYFFGVEDRELTFFYTNNFFGFLAQPWLSVLYVVMTHPWVLLVTFGLPGLALLPKRSAAWLIAGLLASYALPHFVIIAEPRFHLTLVPILLPLAAHACLERSRLAARFTMRVSPIRVPRIAWAGSGLLLALLAWEFVTNWSRLAAALGSGGNQLRLPY